MKLSPEFAAQRSPRRGSANPERMEVPLWEWLVTTGDSAYAVNQQFGDSISACEAGPGWCFDRFGCSETPLPDGRVVHIAGEHEDHYDPDFYIYNDVIVTRPDGGVEIYGYPEEVLPPTDFHSATLVGDRIYLIGNLGYVEARVPGTTPVLALDLADLSIAAVATLGEAPGWIRDHSAELSEDGKRILVRHGEVQGEERSLDNHDDYSLDLTTRTWTRLTRRSWQEWSIRRDDGEDLMLWQMSNAAFQAAHPSVLDAGIHSEEVVRVYEELDLDFDSAKQLAKHGRIFDLEVYEALCVPPIDVEASGTEFEFPVIASFILDGALVRYVDGSDELLLKIDGTLGSPELTALCEDLVQKLARLQASPCAAVLSGRQD